MMKVFPETYTPIQHVYYALNELRYYRDYINRFEQFLKDENQAYERFLNDSDEFLRLGLRFNFETNHSYNLSIGFPNTHRRSTLVSLFSFYENSLNTLCEVYRDHMSLDVGFRDMADKGITRAKLYLIKIVGLSFPTNSNWATILKIQRIRNNIVHSYSEIQKTEKDLLSDIKSLPYTALYPLTARFELQLDEGFLGFVMEKFEGFFVELNESGNKRLNPQ